MNTGDYIYKGIFAPYKPIQPIIASVHCKTTFGTSYYSAISAS